MGADAVLGGGGATLVKPAYTAEKDRARLARLERAAARIVASNATSDTDRELLLAILKTLTQGVDLITVNAVLLQKPSIQPSLVQGLTDKQAAELRNQAAEVDKLAAVNFPGGLAGYQAYQQQQAINQAIKDGKVQVIPIPQGSPVIVQAK
jgi:hypothetical protein